MAKEREPVETQTLHCPMCERPLKGIRDYPSVVIKDVKRLSIPKRVRSFYGNKNIRKEIVRVGENPAVYIYLSAFGSARGRVTKLADIETNFIMDNYYKNHFKIGGYFVGLEESEKAGVANLTIASEINLGSGGGPALISLAKIAEIEYQGVLNEPPVDLLKGMVGAGRGRA